MVSALPTPVSRPVMTPSPPEANEAQDEDWTLITCDGNLLIDYGKNQVAFFRNVQVKNVRGSIRADRLVIFFSPEEEKVERVEAEGDVRVVTEKRFGSSKKIFYYPVQRKIIMLGQVVINEGDNVVGGEKVTFYLDREEVEVEDAAEIELVPQKGFDIQL